MNTNNQTSRSGFVRSNSGGVYKGVEAQSHYTVEYKYQKDYSKLVMFVILPIVVAVAAHIVGLF